MGSNKTKDKRRREHKSTSKTSTSTQPAISADIEPLNFGFLYQIDAVTTSYKQHQKRILSIGASEKKGNEVGRYWYPPIHKSQFKRREGHIYRWPGNEASERLSVHPRALRQYQVASVFFQAKQDNFLAVFKDCVDEEIANEPHGWSQIGFHHLSKPTPYMSQVDIGGEKELLAAPADQTSWMPQVLPSVYNYEKSPLSPSFEGQSGGLCGKLSLLIAMAAFSAPVEFAEDIVSRCFAWKEWEAHNWEVGIGRYQERGVVVKIYLDPDASGVTTSHLKAFEEGKYGPIFDALTPYATSPTQAYTHHSTPPYSSHNPASSTPRTMNITYSPTDTSQHITTPGYAVSPSHTATSGYPASTGNTAASGYPALSMITQSSELYDVEDEKVEDDEK